VTSAVLKVHVLCVFCVFFVCEIIRVFMYCLGSVPADKGRGDANEAAPLYYICETRKETGTTARRIRTGLCRKFCIPVVLYALCVCVCVCVRVSCVFCPQRQEGEKNQERGPRLLLLVIHPIRYVFVLLFCAVCRISHRLLQFRPMWGKGEKVTN